MDNSLNVCAIFIDFAKAFDTANHKILLKKLEKCGIRSVVKTLIKSYVTKRKQEICCDDFSSSLLDINIGVPQGSALGTTLFLIYINDLAYCSNFKTFLYADDSVLTLSRKNNTAPEVKLNQELRKVSDWLKFNYLYLNTAKTKFLFFSKDDVCLSVMIIWK